MNIAFYLRLSAADGDLGVDGKNESNSIENQRLLLQSFVEAKEDIEGEISEFVDDGFSGTNFDRPAFKEMIEVAKQGKIDLILVKDLSRLGRDYITAGDYIEQIFPMLGVRFIAVNSNYDSDKFTNATMGLDMAVNNLVNTLYSRDLSKKMKSANQTRWKNGYNTAGCTPFGYVKDSENKGKWLVDPEAAMIVRAVFDKAVEGFSTSQIAHFLNEEGYPKSGKTVKEIQTITGLSAASVSGYLPYQKTIYNLEESTLVAERLRKFRSRQSAVRQLALALGDGDPVHMEEKL